MTGTQGPLLVISVGTLFLYVESRACFYSLPVKNRALGRARGVEREAGALALAPGHAAVTSFHYGDGKTQRSRVRV